MKIILPPIPNEASFWYNPDAINPYYEVVVLFPDYNLIVWKYKNTKSTTTINRPHPNGGPGSWSSLNSPGYGNEKVPKTVEKEMKKIANILIKEN